ncbi:MAG: tRNA-(ms[2]io[6]A)-hydroxylase [Deltaproteobacteria bacterium]|nr:tRNA-(ms[2]io[6]A)-hydroxylase [Deltaproteobacteria bacterium]
MLHLASSTDPDWARRAIQAMDVILLDHAHLEKKAAGTAVNLIFRYPQHADFMVPLSRLAREELSHFELVLEIMQARDIPFERLRPAPYAGRLMSIVPVDEPLRLQDTLLCCAVIEARSCERMKLLAEHLEDPELKKLYQGLLACEARHHTTYVDLAARIFPEAQVMARLAEVAEHEAEVLAGAPTEPRLHNA